MGFLYETHLHTNQGSICGASPGRNYIRAYKERGFTGIIVTDHFFNSNTRANRALPWDQWVNTYCAGFEEAREEGARLGLDVFFGWEETFDGDDYLVYGLDKDWLLKHPEVRRWKREDQFREVHTYGGCVIQAHPFRQHDYIRDIHLAPFLVDGVEAANAGNFDPFYDRLAMEYARLLGLAAVAGSDIHNAGELAKAEPYGVELDKKLNSVHDYVSLILNRAPVGLNIPRGRCDYQEKDGKTPFALKVDIRDREGRPCGPPKRMNFNEVCAFLAQGS